MPHPVQPILDALSPLGVELHHQVEPSELVEHVGLENLPGGIKARLSGQHSDSVITFSLGDSADANTFVWNGAKPTTGLKRVGWHLARLHHYFRAMDALDETKESYRHRLSEAVRSVHPDLKVNVSFGRRPGEGFVPVHHVVIYSDTPHGRTFIQNFHAGMQDVTSVDSYEAWKSRPKGIWKWLSGILD